MFIHCFAEALSYHNHNRPNVFSIIQPTVADTPLNEQPCCNGNANHCLTGLHAQSREANRGQHVYKKKH